MEFRLVDRATLAPSRCFCCQANDGPMIDTGIRGRLPFGAVYICVNRCVPALVKVAGGLTGPEVKHLLSEQGKRLGQIAEMQAELGRLRRLEQAVAEARDEVPA